MEKKMATNHRTQEDKALGLKDYWAIARRRAQLILLTGLAVTISTVLVVRRLPNLYRAETTILVDPQQVPNSYVASTVSSNISDRLSTIQQEVTSPTRLKRLIDSLRHSGHLKTSGNDQETIASMQRAITVQILEQSGHGLSAFKVGYQGTDPVEVAEIANQLAEMFISENLKVRERQSYGTAEFLEDELKRTKEQLDQKQAALNEVKDKYILDLPESKQYHLEALTTLRTQLQSSQDRVNQAQQEKVYLQSMMVTQAPTLDMDSGSNNSVYSPQIQKLEAQLSSLRSHYGDQHPDVRKLTAELNELKEMEKQAAGDSASDKPPTIREASGAAALSAKNPVLSAQLQKLDETIEKEKTLQQQLQQQIAVHVSKLQTIPVFEQRISGMMWDYDSLRNHYAELESKKLSADMSSALEVHEKAERFVPLDRAVPPTHPYGPQRLLIMVAGLLAGLGLGLGLAIIREMSADLIYSRSEIIGLVGDVPILGDIPQISTARETVMRRVQVVVAVLATTALSSVAGVVIAHFAVKAW